MNNLSRIFTEKFSFYGLMAIIGIILVVLAPKAAINVDEMLHYPHAKKVVNWYFTGGEDVSCLNTPDTNLKYYGQSADNFTALINRIFNIKNEFLTRHLTGAVFFWLLLLFSGLFTFLITRHWWVSFVAVLTLIFYPPLSGHSFGNLKDIPFAAGYIAAMYYMAIFIREIPKPRWKTTIFLALAIAFTCSVRIGGLILFFYLALFSVLYIALKPFFLKQFFTTKSLIVRLLGQSIVILLVGYFAGLLFWPFALQNVIANPFESLKVMEHYKISIRQVFEGGFFWSTDLPSYYLPKWLFMSSPEFIFIGMIIFLFFSILKIRHISEVTDSFFSEILILFASLFPLFYVIIIDSNLYSGTRQILFTLPGISVLLSVSIFKLSQSTLHINLKKTILIIFFGLMILPLAHQIKTFPADYIYFNTISGGNKKAWGNFEYDYYFHGIKKPAEELIETIKKEKEVIVASNCNLSAYFDRYPTIKFQYTRFLERSSVNWDYAIFGLNYIHPLLLKTHRWQPQNVVKTFYHSGNPVAIIVKRENKTDLDAISKLNEGKLNDAKILLSQVVKSDSLNVWLYVQLSQIYFAENNFELCRKYIYQGKKIYPFYEPLNLLEAKCLFQEKKFAESLKVLQNLQNFNSLYEPGIELMKKTKEKL